MKNLDDFIKDLPKNQSELIKGEDNRLASLIPEDEMDLEVVENEENN